MTRSLSELGRGERRWPKNNMSEKWRAVLLLALADWQLALGPLGGVGHGRSQTLPGGGSSGRGTGLIIQQMRRPSSVSLLKQRELPSLF